MAWLKKMMFGRKTEQSSVIMDNCTQLPLFPGMQTPAVKKAEETVTVPEHKGKLSDAVRYALHEKPHLYTFLENGDVPLDNNRAENAIRPFAVGRKNWMHCNTANGASWTAILYSLLATAQANGIDAERYLTDLFSQPAGTIILPFDS